MGERQLMSDGSWCDCAPLCWKLRFGPHGCHRSSRTGPAERRREDRGALCRNAPPKPNSKCRLADAPPDRRHTTPPVK